MVGVRAHARPASRMDAGRGGKRDRVALRLAQLRLAVHARQPADRGNQGAGLGQDLPPDLPVGAADDLVGSLDERGLVLPDRDHARLERGGVGSLGDGVAAKSRPGCRARTPVP